MILKWETIVGNMTWDVSQAHGTLLTSPSCNVYVKTLLKVKEGKKRNSKSVRESSLSNFVPPEMRKNPHLMKLLLLPQPNRSHHGFLEQLVAFLFSRLPTPATEAPPSCYSEGHRLVLSNSLFMGRRSHCWGSGRSSWGQNFFFWSQAQHFHTRCAGLQRVLMIHESFYNLFMCWQISMWFIRARREKQLLKC